MNCPNCNQKMKHEKDFYQCLRCGYMSNGNTINLEEHKESDLKKYLGEKFETVNYNKNFFVTFLFGPFYLCYKKCFWSGFLLLELDIFLSIGSALLTSSTVIMWSILIFMHIIYGIILNEVYVFLIKRKIKKDIEKNQKLTISQKSSILLPILAIEINIFIIVVITYLYQAGIMQSII